MCWHFGLRLEDRKQQSITFHLALHFSFLSLLLCNNRLRTQQREALDLPTAWPYTFASWHDSHCNILPWAFSLDQGNDFGMGMLWAGGALGCCCCEELGVCLVLSPLGSLVFLLFVQLPTLKQRTHRRSLVSLVSPAALLLSHWQRPACDCVSFIHLHSACEDASVSDANLSCHETLGDLLTSWHCCFYKS